MKKASYTIAMVLLMAISLIASNPKETFVTYEINKSQSKIKWTGYHLAKSYEHWGNVSVKSGEVDISGDEVTGGNIKIDMKSITCGDIEDQGKNKKLVNDLKSENFFYVKRHSTATLEIKKSTLSESGGSSISADITIRGITKPITFELFQDETNDQIILTSELMIDRTEHEVLYGWSLENVVISGEFKLEVKIVLDK